MRKALSIFLALLTAFTLFACGTGANVEKEENSSEATDNPTGNIASIEESSSANAGKDDETSDNNMYDSENISIVKSEKLEFEILEAGFCNVSQMWYTEYTSTRSIEGKKYEVTEYREMEYTSDDSHILFVIKARIKNISEHSLVVDDDLEGYISFNGKDGKAYAQTFPFQAAGSSKRSVIRSGNETDALCISWLPIDYYNNYKGCTYQLLDVSVSFDENVGLTESIKFELPEDEIVELADDNGSVNRGVPLSFTYVRLPDGQLAKVYYESEMGRSNIDCELEITDCVISETGNNYAKVAVSLENLTDENMPVVIVGYQLLDESGDALSSGEIAIDGISANGKGTGTAVISNQTAKDFSSVRFVYYSVASHTFGNNLLLNYSVNFSENNIFDK